MPRLTPDSIKGDDSLPEGKKVSELRTRKRLEQKAIDVVSEKSDAADGNVKPVSPTGKKALQSKM
jgi:hypothetical protein